MPHYRLERSCRASQISTRRKKKILNPLNEITTSVQPPSRFPSGHMTPSFIGMAQRSSGGTVLRILTYRISLSPQFSLYLVSPNLFHPRSGTPTSTCPFPHAVRNCTAKPPSGHRPPVSHTAPTAAKNRAIFRDSVRPESSPRTPLSFSVQI